MNRKLLAASVLSVSLVIPTFAHAACTLANIAGTWQAYIHRYNGTPVPSWAQCKMVINATTGAITNTSCKIMPVATHSLTAGKWTLNSGPNCTFTATFKINNVTHTVQHSTLGKGFNHLSGAGQSTQQSLLINMVRPN